MANIGKVAAYLGGGLLAGVGASLIETQKEKFQERLKQLEIDAADKRLDKQQTFEAGQNDKKNLQQSIDTTAQLNAAEKRNQDSIAGENTRNAATIAGQNERTDKDNAARADATKTTKTELVQKDDGSIVVVYPDGTTKPAVNGDGTPLKGRKFGTEDVGKINPVTAVSNAIKINTDVLGDTNWDGVITSLQQMGVKPTDDLLRQAGKPPNKPSPTQPPGTVNAAEPVTPSNQRPPGAPSDAKKAADGNWYSPDPQRPGKYLKW